MSQGQEIRELVKQAALSVTESAFFCLETLASELKHAEIFFNDGALLTNARGGRGTGGLLYSKTTFLGYLN